MHWQTRLVACLATLLTYISRVRTAPELTFPINSQVPPVAFATQAYTFSFSPSTFKFAQTDISYSLSDVPVWLSLDSSTRTLKGTPSADDVGAATFHLVAKDADGQTSAPVTLVVLQSPGVRNGQPIGDSLRSAGPVSAPATLLLKPLQNFRVQVVADVFVGNSDSTTYYAVSADSSPLPPWVQFDSKALTFSGSSPPLVSPSAGQQFYSIHLVATSVVGFAEAIVGFEIAISHHTLAFAQISESIAVKPYESFQSRSFRNHLSRDGAPIEDNDITSVSSDLPAWASLDEHDISVFGTPPAGFQTDSVTVVVTDNLGNRASLIVDLRSISSTDQNQTSTVNLQAVPGTFFSYKLNNVVVRGTDKFSADLKNASDWMHFSAQNLTLYGCVPPKLKQQTLQVLITDGSNNSDLSLQVLIHIEAPQTPTTTPSFHSSSSSSTMSNKASTNSNDMTSLPTGTRTSSQHIIALVLTTILISLAVLAVIIICIFWRRTRAKRNGVEAQKELSARASFQTEAVPDTADLPHVIEEPRISNDLPRQITPVYVPPPVELPWAPDSPQRVKDRLSKRFRMKNQRSIDFSWGELLVPTLYQDPPQPLSPPPVMRSFRPDTVATSPPIPSYSARRQLQNGKRISKQSSTKTARRSKVFSTISNGAIDLPKRMSGAGHGSGVLVPETTASIANTLSRPTKLASIPQGDTRSNVNTLALFPRLLEDQENTGLGILVDATKPSSRLVDRSSELSEFFEIQRQRWHTDRAKDRLEGSSRFSNAVSSSRNVSLSKLPATPKSSSRTLSSPIPKNATINSRLSRPSWSNWSAVGPAARAESIISARTPPPLFAQQSRPPRDVSMASSGQFDSALSSDSQWEDENLVAGVKDNGGRHWISDNESDTASPRLPFEPFSSSDEVGKVTQLGVVKGKGARFIDKRQRVDVDEEGLRRSEKSQSGSFRFI